MTKRDEYRRAAAPPIRYAMFNNYKNGREEAVEVKRCLASAVAATRWAPRLADSNPLRPLHLDPGSVNDRFDLDNWSFIFNSLDLARLLLPFCRARPL
ncbi:hypothetical protein [Desulfuromonas thiophila]|uniref:hypothetical protein n=1 Tax=Desulfuromonas thiophila TaxID=57664 RepID=UPI0029F502A8|nr:hypothetical protein [Desulfuromonas thiophila]